MKRVILARSVSLTDMVTYPFIVYFETGLDREHLRKVSKTMLGNFYFLGITLIYHEKECCCSSW